MINVTETIKNLREEYKISQETLARAIYVDKATISNYESYLYVYPRQNDIFSFITMIC